MMELAFVSSAGSETTWSFHFDPLNLSLRFSVATRLRSSLLQQLDQGLWKHEPGHLFLALRLRCRRSSTPRPGDRLDLRLHGCWRLQPTD